MKRTHQRLALSMVRGSTEWCKLNPAECMGTSCNAHSLVFRLAWALTFFAASLLFSVWRTGPIDSPSVNGKTFTGLSSRSTTYVVRAAITTIFDIGIIHLILIIYTLSRYGSRFDHKWKVKVGK
ncbi:hypothetical protein AN958_01894 [Leucoagaricus sp. SymC.cos]|nr:hypothetical protein AN958_01894 [Leucoagaricus sp. SymC.cos]